MSKFVIGDESNIVPGSSEDECCEVCIYWNEEDSICSKWRVETNPIEVCPNFEEREDNL